MSRFRCLAPAFLSLFLAVLPPSSKAAEKATRDPWLQPFARTSIWNMPVGDAAVYVPAGLGPASTIGLDLERLHRVAPGAPKRKVFAPKSWNQRAGGTIELGAVPIDDDFLVPDAAKWSTPNEAGALLMPDGRTLHHFGVMCRPEPTGPLFAYYFHPETDLFGDGAHGGHGGSGLSALGGSIRRGELTGNQPIRHALKVDLFCKKYAYYGTDRKGLRWPATLADEYAKTGYQGTNRAVVMGSLLALPPSLQVEKLELRTEIGKKLFHALQDYGAYLVDDAAWDCHYLCAEYGVHEEVERHYGMKFDGSSKPLLADINALFTWLQVIDNNAPDRIGGGGNPRVALAPPLASAAASPPGPHRPLQKKVLAVRNASFSDGAATADHWKDLWTAAGAVTPHRDTAVFHSAPAALRLDSVGGPATGQVFQFVDGPAGTFFDLRAKVKSEGESGTRGVLGVQCYTADYQGLGFTAVGAGLAGRGWQTAAGRVTLPDKTARFAVVLMLEGQGRAWLDDVEIVRAYTPATQSP